ncbi:MAG: PQQ-dependent sugar dehydrogenase, partial [Gammaproteobacteria bacterium]|nr:PQQ-dependent sugar dehydrogenase [Gammaproteobacteria bacterium]
MTAPGKILRRLAAPVLLLAATLTGAQAGAAPSLRVVTVAEGIEMGWAFQFLPGGDLLVTER